MQPSIGDEVFVLCGLSWAAALIHVYAAGWHIDEDVLYSVFFAGLALTQVAWGIAVCRWRPPAVLLGGAVGSLLVVALWTLSRTHGLPFGPDPGKPEEVGAADAIATADELGIALLAIVLALRAPTTRLPRVLHLIAIPAAIALISLSAMSALLGGHEHAAAHSLSSDSEASFVTKAFLSASTGSGLRS